MERRQSPPLASWKYLDQRDASLKIESRGGNYLEGDCMSLRQKNRDDGTLRWSMEFDAKHILMEKAS